MFKMWDRLAKENGVSGLTFAIQGAEWNTSEGGTSQSGDYRIMYEPGYTGTQKRISKGGADVHNLDISADFNSFTQTILYSLRS